CRTFDAGGTARPSVLPDISPTWGEIGCRIGFRQSPMLKKGAVGRAANLPLVGEMSGRTEGARRIATGTA
ncbi:MAG: hypothetical protein E5X63_25135, partial [Mesorhizobium sp.]